MMVNKLIVVIENVTFDTLFILKGVIQMIKKQAELNNVMSNRLSDYCK